MLKETIHQVRQLLVALSRDLEKAAKGNASAAQRVRTGSIEFAKVAKVFRKESVATERASRPVKKVAVKSARKKKR